MPNVRMAIEYLKDLDRKGRGNEVVHVVLVEEEAKKRKENVGPNPRTRFQIETDDPELYSRFVGEKDRIIKRVRNKAIALDFMYRAWRDALSDAELDRMLAEEEGAPR
jgi:hypothetical protein